MTDHPTAADLDAMEARCDERRDMATRVTSVGWYATSDRGDPLRDVKAALRSTDLPAVIALAREAMGLLDAANEYVPGDDPVGRALGRDIDTLLTAYHGPGDGQPKGGGR